MNTELAHESGHHTEKSDVLEVTGTNEIIKTIGSIGSQRASRSNCERTFSRVEAHFKRLWSFFREFGWIGKIRNVRSFILFFFFVFSRFNQPTGQQSTDSADPN